jgi:general secretion pathway protein G
MPRGAVPKDGWKRDLLYRAPGEHDPHPYDVESHGRDGADGGEGYDRDIVNWYIIDHEPG